MTEDVQPVPPDGAQPAAVEKPPLFAEDKPPLFPEPGSAAASEPVPTRPLWIAFLAAAGVALISGLVWAGISIATGYNLGILAVLIGAATGLTAAAVAGGGIGGFERALSALFAALAIILGDYVIDVHYLKDIFAKSGLSTGYFDSDQINDFVKHFGTYVSGRDWLWIAIAAFVAFRTSGGKGALGMGRKRS